MVRDKPAEPSVRRDHEVHRRVRESVSRHTRSDDMLPRPGRWLVSPVVVVEQERPEAAYAFGRPSTIVNSEIGGHGNAFCRSRRRSVDGFDCDAPLVETPVLSLLNNSCRFNQRDANRNRQIDDSAHGPPREEPHCGGSPKSADEAIRDDEEDHERPQQAQHKHQCEDLWGLLDRCHA